MLIQEFEQAYCQDILAQKSHKEISLDWTILPYEMIIEDENGVPKPVVMVDGEPVHTRDFVEMEREHFCYVHNTPNAGEYFDNYVSDLQLTEGTEMFTYFQQKAREEVKKLHENADLAMELAL